MKDLIAIIDTDCPGWVEVESSLASLGYSTSFVEDLPELQRLTDRPEARVAVIDLDRVAVDNRFFRSLKRANPELMILALSSHPFHPELKESMVHHICACFRKPIEPDEIEFWLKAVVSKAPPRGPTISPET